MRRKPYFGSDRRENTSCHTQLYFAYTSSQIPLSQLFQTAAQLSEECSNSTRNVGKCQKIWQLFQQLQLAWTRHQAFKINAKSQYTVLLHYSPLLWESNFLEFQKPEMFFFCLFVCLLPSIAEEQCYKHLLSLYNQICCTTALGFIIHDDNGFMEFPKKKIRVVSGKTAHYFLNR